MKKNFGAVLIAAALLAASGCSTVFAEKYSTMPEIPEIKDGCYRSDSDNSYLMLSDGYIELVGYDLESILPQKYEEGVEKGFIDPEKDPYDEFCKNSIEGFRESSGKKKYSVKAMPDKTVWLVTEANETGNGGGSFEGYIVIDENTLKWNENSYIYSNN